MIRRLRIKFIVFFMGIVTIMLCIILTMVYFFTKTNLENISINMMQDIANQPFKPGLPNDLPKDVRLPYFIVQTDFEGKLLAIDGGYYDLSDEEFLDGIIERASSYTKPLGVIEEYNLRFYHTKTPIGQSFVFADMSSEIATLNSLIKNCILIGLLGFLLFFGLSSLLANWAIKPVDSAWKQQKQFIADASHELKTPLTVIMTNAELVQDSAYDEESRAAFSASILVMSRQMKNLVEQMLELARSDNMDSKLAVSEVDFSRLVSNAILPFEPVFYEKGLGLNTRISEKIKIKGDAGLLQQALDILLDNAQKYSRKNGSTWVTLEKYGKGRCLLSVANEGDEIAPEDLDNLFKRFYRTDGARVRTGSFGLGLSIAESIVHRHKGKIWAESGNGVNTFFVEFHCKS